MERSGRLTIVFAFGAFLAVPSFLQAQSPATVRTVAASPIAIPPPRVFQAPAQADPAAPPAIPPFARSATSASKGTVNLNAAPLEPGDFRFPINLATALRLADARPLIVAAAQASVWVAEAELTRAKVLWVPTLNIGFDYLRHDGGGPTFNKGILTAPSVNFFYGGGGLTADFALTDAIFQPLAARQVLNSAQWNIQAAKNDALLMTADAYFSVHQYRGMYAGSLYCVQRGHELIERVMSMKTDLVASVEVDRARSLVASLEQQATSAREEWRVHSANLTQVLRLDPRAVVVPLEHDHLQLTLIDPARPLDDLIPVGLTNRPELAAYQAIVQSVAARIRREKGRLLLPSMMLNGFQTPGALIQAGVFGLGSNSSMNQWVGREDVSVQPVWQYEALGIGNLARIKEQRGMQSGAIIELFKMQDQVAADLTRAQARLQSAAARVAQADRGLRASIITFNGTFDGLRQTSRFGGVLYLVNRPQEVVFALQLLKQSFDNYFATVGEYNRAEFLMFHALGYPAREIANLKPPGEVLPVDTARPEYLPPVGNGPPPATR